MFRSVFIPTKEKPKKCKPVIGCSSCRTALKEWKKTEQIRKDLTKQETNWDLAIFKTSLFFLFAFIALGGLQIYQGDHDAAGVSFMGAVAWAIVVFVTDHNLNKEDNQ